MQDGFGDGWGDNMWHWTDPSGYETTGTLHDGSIGTDQLCISGTSCYTFFVDDGVNYPRYWHEHFTDPTYIRDRDNYDDSFKNSFLDDYLNNDDNRRRHRVDDDRFDHRDDDELIGFTKKMEISFVLTDNKSGLTVASGGAAGLGYYYYADDTDGHYQVCPLKQGSRSNVRTVLEQLG